MKQQQKPQKPAKPRKDYDYNKPIGKCVVCYTLSNWHCYDCSNDFCGIHYEDLKTNSPMTQSYSISDQRAHISDYQLLHYRYSANLNSTGFIHNNKSG